MTRWEEERIELGARWESNKFSLFTAIVSVPVVVSISFVHGKVRSIAVRLQASREIAFEASSVTQGLGAAKPARDTYGPGGPKPWATRTLWASPNIHRYIDVRNEGPLGTFMVNSID